MRPFLVLGALLCSTSAFAVPALELELSGGALGHDFVSAPAPTLGARVGLDLFDLVTLSVRAMSLSRFEKPRQDIGLLADVHVHSRGRFQVNGGLGLGLAIASVEQAGGGLDVGYATVRPFPLLDVGVRLNLWRCFIGLNVGGWPFGVPSWVGTASVGISLFGD